VKKLISIGVALALLAMVVMPVAVAAQDPIPPDTYAKTPFSIVAEGFRLIGELLDMEEAKMGFIGYDLGQFMEPIADFTAGPLGWSVDMVAWGVDIVAQVAGPIIDEFAPDYGWLTDVLDDVVCKIIMPWDSIVCP
jgi:hypothetical protein